MATYRQIAHKLRIHRPGQPDRVSVRPRAGNAEQGWGAYLDSEAFPTLIEIEAEDVVDVEALLRSGAIAPWEPPPAEETTDEQSSS